MNAKLAVYRRAFWHRSGVPESSKVEDERRRALYATYRSGLGADATSSTEEASGSPYFSQLIRRHFPKDPSVRVLEVGCGDGHLLELARSHGFSDVEGIDLSIEQVERAHRLGRNFVRLADAITVLGEKETGSVDVLLAFDVLEHLPESALLPFLKAAKRTLSKGGRLLIHTINAQSPFFGRIRYGDFTHTTAFTPQSLRQLLLVAGFSRADALEDSPVIHGAKSALRALAWKVIRLALIGYVTAETGGPGADAIFSQNFLMIAFPT